MASPSFLVARTTVGLAALLALAGMSGAYAQSGDSDWQEFGTEDFGKGGQLGVVVLFFDAAGAIRRENGHVEVWTKGLSQKALVRARNNPGSRVDKKIIDQVTDKKVQKYRPPLSTVRELDDDRVMELLIDEAEANVAGIVPKIKTLYELDCQNRLLRALSTAILLDGEPHYRETPMEWSHVAPESSASNLLRFVCTQH